jgi:hypothetical protein
MFRGEVIETELVKAGADHFKNYLDSLFRIKFVKLRIKMKSTLVLLSIAFISLSFRTNDLQKTADKSRFNIEKDLLLAQFDCKTDVDDIHSAAALVTLLSNSNFSKLKYHVVAGSYGVQEGLYVPPNDLFQLAFGNKWSDAHKNFESAINQVKVIAEATLTNGGDVWIAEGGQSDFSAGLIRAIQSDLPNVKTSQRIHLVQHSDWNEKVTSAESLKFVKQNSDYNKIADGNVVGNGTPGFRSPDYKDWQKKIKNPRLIDIWKLATEIGHKYNGKEGRYNNEAVSSGGLDFSDLSETCWILGVENIKDTEEFFNLYGN